MVKQKGTNQEEALAFIDYCKATQLNPFLNEIYLVKMGGNNVPMVSYQTYIDRAQQGGDLLHYTVNMFCEDKIRENWYAECVIIKKSSGKDLPWKFMTYYSEVANGTNPIWKAKPRLMLEKCAIANSFRKAFQMELKNLPYAIEESWKVSHDILEAQKHSLLTNKKVEIVVNDKETPTEGESSVKTLENGEE